MSNIYVHEPPTNGKVLLQTTVGDIEIELWSKEAPKACRNFVQLCMEGYYNKTIFHRVVRDFIVQGGDPLGDGSSHGESIYGKPFSDEFHSRIRFVRRGLVAMANNGPNDNTSHFFFTLAATPELNNKNTIFGRIGGDTIYNALKLVDAEVDKNDRPLFPHKILKTKVIVNPFDDIVPRILKSKTDDDETKKKISNSKATKNFGLLTFGEEAEKEEDDLMKMPEKINPKSKSSHDLLDDKYLSKDIRPKKNNDDDYVEGDVKMSDSNKKDDDSDEGSMNSKKVRLDGVKEKLRRKKMNDAVSKKKNQKDDDDDDDEVDDKKRRKRQKYDDESDKSDDADGNNKDLKYPELEYSSKNRIKKLKEEAKQLKKELLGDSKGGDDKKSDKNSGKDNVNQTSVKSFKRDLKKYENSKTSQQPKGADREKTTLDLLSRFQDKLNSTKRLTAYDSDDDENDEDANRDPAAEKDDDFASNKDLSWMTHRLKFIEETNAATTAAKSTTVKTTKTSTKPAIDSSYNSHSSNNKPLASKVLDANVADSDRYVISDPRNPINARRRKESSMKMKKR
ncbi:hypothetical protein HELRODRAFT_189319 [Helobdella robusta]|uniref:Spliceosome-associated protein CWC27 homolog n=1 Tax=Helobdella robusta TaxID=6412 RepID=T1FQY2_HELRO|nr:hypothetical protein HELRODRAFT_189319 [Helobdella robusta]ESN96627.1 hypothetical protein HELRODRAFT_189319 [Helobdella robusta]